MRHVILTLVSLGFLVLVGQPAEGAQYLRLIGDSGPIEGESQHVMYPRWIEITAWGIGFQTNASHGPGGGAGKTQLTHLDFVMPASIASPQILEHLLLGRLMPEAKLALVRTIATQPREYASWEFKDVLVTKWDQSSSDGHPVERFSLLPAEVEYTYFEYDQEGKLRGQQSVSWNFLTNTTSTSTVGTVENFQLYTGTIVPEPAGIAMALLSGGTLLMRRGGGCWSRR